MGIVNATGDSFSEGSASSPETALDRALRLLDEGADLLDIGGEALIVSQFTLYGDAAHGRRPSFTAAARPETAIPLYEAFIEAVRSYGVRTETGRFGADMQLAIFNDGPVTLMVESRTK